MHKVIYTSGSHGNFIKHLLFCYQEKNILPINFNDNNGNSHDINKNNNSSICYDLVNDQHSVEFYKKLNSVDKVWGITFDGIEQFSYVLKCCIDRVGALNSSGLDLIEKDINCYIKETEVDMFSYYYEVFLNCFGLDIKKLEKIPRSVLRNYFCFIFFYHMDHGIWKNNQKIKKIDCEHILLSEILEYKKIKKKLDEIFVYDLDFYEIHTEFLKFNRPYKTINIEQTILKAIMDEKSMEVPQLDIVTEAYILYSLEVKYFDIPFIWPNNFFKNTGEIIEYIKYFPRYLKNPNKIFTDKVYSRYYKK